MSDKDLSKNEESGIVRFFKSLFRTPKGKLYTKAGEKIGLLKKDIKQEAEELGKMTMKIPEKLLKKESSFTKESFMFTGRKASPKEKAKMKKRRKYFRAGVAAGALGILYFGSKGRAGKFKGFRSSVFRRHPDKAHADVLKRYGAAYNPNMSKADFKNMRRGMLFKHHPDRGGSEEIFKNVNATLNEIKRRHTKFAYDIRLKVIWKALYERRNP